jgi:hypothetical protein
MTRRLLLAMSMSARELLRSRLVLLLLVLVPTLFFSIIVLTTDDDPLVFELGSVGDGVALTVPQQDEAMVFVGLASVGLITSFLGLRLMQRDVEVSRRLVLCGYRPWELIAAKLAVLAAVVLAISAYVVAALPLFFEPQRLAGVWLGFVLGGWVYGCWGLLVGALIRRQLEGILFVVLLTNIDAGWLQNPVWYAEAQNTAVIRALPAHLPSQTSMAAAFSDLAIAAPAAGSLAYGAVFLLLAVGINGWRMRERR